MKKELHQPGEPSDESDQKDSSSVDEQAKKEVDGYFNWQQENYAEAQKEELELPGGYKVGDLVVSTTDFGHLKWKGMWGVVTGEAPGWEDVDTGKRLRVKFDAPPGKDK